MSSIHDHSLFNISHENNHIFLNARESNPRVTITNLKLIVYLEVTHHLVPSRQHALLPEDSLSGIKSCVTRATFYYSDPDLFSGGGAAATSAVEHIIASVPFDLGNSGLCGPLLSDVDFPTDIPLEGVSGVVARVLEVIKRVVATGAPSMAIDLSIIKRTIIDAEMYRGLVYQEYSGNDNAVVFEMVVVSESDDLVCAICMEEVCSGTHAARLPCTHRFHGDCVLPWLNCKKTCPICRFKY